MDKKNKATAARVWVPSDANLRLSSCSQNQAELDGFAIKEQDVRASVADPGETAPSSVAKR
jgi:hypothetical protein